MSIGQRIQELKRRFSMLSHRRKFDRELDEELRLHAELREREQQELGISSAAAHREARIATGNALALREDSRAAWSWAWLENFAQDLRFALRMLRKAPGFTLVAVLTLALGIGANAAIFSVVYAVLLAPLPYRNASRLVVVNETTPKVGKVSVSYPDFLDWRKQSRAFSVMVAVDDVSFSMAGASQPENISGEAVSPHFLSMLGVHPLLGRDFGPSEEESGTAPVVMLSYALWQSHFAGDRSALGRAILLDGQSYTVIGVLPANFRTPDRSDVLEPIGVWATKNSDAMDRGARGDMVVIGRLAPGVSFGKARAEMEGIAAELAKEYPASNDEFGVALQPIRDAFVGNTRTAILVLFAAVMFVLLIACANVANLFLVRGAARTKEIALRIAFGAGWGRIVRQMLTESFVLAMLGGVVGLAFAAAGTRGLAQMIPADALSGAAVHLNGAVLLFDAGAVLLCAFAFGLVPALHATKQDVQSELKESARTSSAGAAENRLRAALAVAEIALALVLSAAAGLMMKSLYRLMAVNPGFQTGRILTMEMDLRTQQYDKDPAIRNFWQRTLDQVRALPGVESAALGTVVPLTGDHSRTDITMEGMVEPRPGSWPHPDYHIVSPGYLRTLGIPLLRGRTFTAEDNESTPLVGMINAKLAKEFSPNQNPIGKRFMFGHPSKTEAPRWITIVGVVADTKLYGLANPARLEVYVSYLQFPDSDMHLLVKSAVDPAALTKAIRGVVASIDKNQPIFAIETMNSLRNDAVSTRKITLILLEIFSALALGLATIGIYGVMSYAVERRTHEIGIRVALGAQHRDVLRMILGQGGAIAIAGIAIGLCAAMALTQLMSSLLFSISPFDPLTFAAVSALLIVVTLLACFFPARRAMKVDPVVALRYE